MKKIAMLVAICITICSVFTACGNKDKTEKKNETKVAVQVERDVEYFKNAFSEKYNLTDIDKPLYEMIYADDGIMFYIEENVVKIYQYSDSKNYERAVREFSFVGEMPQNGKFVMESSTDEYNEFFLGIQ